MKNQKLQKAITLSIKIASWLVVAFAVFMMAFTIFTITTVNKNERDIFGTRFYIVRTDSMSKSELNKDLDVHFKAGDIILVKNVEDPKKLEAGDIISFISTNSESYGSTITHMIRRVEYDEKDGSMLGYVTFGTNTDTDDEAIVAPEYVLGKYAGKIPSLGNFFAFTKTVPGYIVCILVPFLFLILYNGANVVQLFKKYTKEQNTKIEEEREALAAERKQNEDMLRELQALKAQLEMKSNSADGAEDNASVPTEDGSET